MNQSKLFINIGDNVSLKIEVCSNPRAHRIFWVAPNFRSMKIGGREKDIKVDNLIAKKLIESPLRVTCVQALLYIKEFGYKDEGEYNLIAKNRYGFDGDSVVLKVFGGLAKRRERERSASSSRKRNSEQLPQINSSIHINTSCAAPSWICRLLITQNRSFRSRLLVSHIPQPPQSLVLSFNFNSQCQDSRQFFKTEHCYALCFTVVDFHLEATLPQIL